MAQKPTLKTEKTKGQRNNAKERETEHSVKSHIQTASRYRSLTTQWIDSKTHSNTWWYKTQSITEQMSESEGGCLSQCNFKLVKESITTMLMQRREILTLTIHHLLSPPTPRSAPECKTTSPTAATVTCEQRWRSLASRQPPDRCLPIGGWCQEARRL